MVNKSQKFKLFLGTFVSAFLLIFGLGTLLSMFSPVFVDLITPSFAYTPQLPISADRDAQFLDINSIPARTMYPALSSVENVEEGNWIRIPAINVNVPLVLSPSIEDHDVINTLDNGAALYPNGIMPGRLGNVFIAAHSTGEPWKGKYRFAFLDINELEPGHVINLDYEGTRYTYKIVGSDIVTPSGDFKVESGRPKPTVTLMACWPLWSTKQRMLIIAELTNITKLTERPN